jgi:hypothetical protein
MRALAIMVVLSSVAHAAPAGGVDWAQGLVTADGVGLADRHAPNPAVARGTSRRDAEAAAKKQLAVRVAALPVAGGGTVGDKAKGNKAVAARIDSAIDAALTVDAEPETDGSWRVTLGVPIEAVRQAIGGVRAVAAGQQDSGPAVVVVDGVIAKPAVGWTVGGVGAATVWVTKAPAWASDAPHVKATSAKKGAIDVGAGMQGPAATLFVIMTSS